MLKTVLKAIWLLISSIVIQVGAPRIKLQDSQGVFSERPVEIRGSDNLNVAQNILQAFMASAGQSVSAQAGSYHNVNALQGSYHNMNPQRSPYQMNSQQSPFQMSSQQSPLPFQMSFQQSPYQNNPQRSPYQINAPQSPYQINATQSPYQLSAQQGSYPNINASHGAYHNYNSQQGTYQYRLWFGNFCIIIDIMLLDKDRYPFKKKRNIRIGIISVPTGYYRKYLKLSNSFEFLGEVTRPVMCFREL